MLERSQHHPNFFQFWPQIIGRRSRRGKKWPTTFWKWPSKFLRHIPLTEHLRKIISPPVQDVWWHRTPQAGRGPVPGDRDSIMLNEDCLTLGSICCPGRNSLCSLENILNKWRSMKLARLEHEEWRGVGSLSNIVHQVWSQALCSIVLLYRQLRAAYECQFQRHVNSNFRHVGRASDWRFFKLSNH